MIELKNLHKYVGKEIYSFVFEDMRAHKGGFRYTLPIVCPCKLIKYRNAFDDYGDCSYKVEYKTRGGETAFSYGLRYLFTTKEEAIKEWRKYVKHMFAAAEREIANKKIIIEEIKKEMGI